jgi:hypothetical protein
MSRLKFNDPSFNSQFSLRFSQELWTRFAIQNGTFIQPKNNIKKSINHHKISRKSEKQKDTGKR